MVVRITGERVCLWRAVDHQGEVLAMPARRRCDTRAALRLMCEPKRRVIREMRLPQPDRVFRLVLFLLDRRQPDEAPDRRCRHRAGGLDQLTK
jgi:hypothetical protein